MLCVGYDAVVGTLLFRGELAADVAALVVELADVRVFFPNHLSCLSRSEHATVQRKAVS